MNKLINIFSVFLLMSCTVGPDYKSPVFFSDDDLQKSLHIQKGEKAEQISSDWYKQFNDKTLNELIETTLLQNPNAAAAVERLRQARYSFKINRVSMWPTIDIDGGYHKLKDNASYGRAVTTDYFQTGFDAVWELDIWGGGRRLTESAQALVNAASANLNNVRLSLIAETAANYINLRQIQKQLEISRQNLHLQQQIYNLVREKYTLGLTDDLTLNQAQYLLENTKTAIPAFEAEEAAYKNALAILAGYLPGALDETLTTPKHNLVSTAYKYDIKKLSRLPLDIIRRRPDVQAAEQNLISENALIGKAVADLFPGVSLSAFLGYQNKNISGLVNSHKNAYSYVPGITMPLLHWGALLNNVELQKSRKDESLKLYQVSLLAAAEDIRNATIKLKQEYRSNAAVKRAWLAQRQVSDLTIDKYKQGLLEFSDVLTAQQNLLSSQTAYLNSNAAVFLNIISFYKAIGGGVS